MSSVNLTIDKFGGGDFSLFSLKLRLALSAQGLWEVVSGEDGKPDGSDLRKLKEWTEKSTKALGVIGLALKDNVLVGLGVHGMKSGKELWDKLESSYGKKTTTSRLLLRQQLAQIQMSEGEDVTGYINRVNGLVDELQMAGVDISEEDIVAKILMGLPRSWAPLVTALENVDESVLTREYVCNRLQHEQQKMGNSEVAMVSYSKKENNGSKKWRQGQVNHGKDERKEGDRNKGRFLGKCFHCGKSGHRQSECFQLKKMNGSKIVEKGKASVAQTQDSEAYLFMTRNVPVNDGSWLIDSGASEHMTSERESFSNYEELHHRVVRIANGEPMRVAGQGVVEIRGEADGEERVIRLTGVLHVPGLAASLISVGKLMMRGYEIVFVGNTCKIVDKEGKVAATGTIKREGIIELKKMHVQKAFVVQQNEESSQLWHRRLGHVALSTIENMVKEGRVTGMGKVTRAEKEEFCVACVEGKQHASAVSKVSDHRAKDILMKIHSDVAGPMSEMSRQGFRYYVEFIDDYSRMTWVYPLSGKHEVAARFKEFKTWIENQTGKRIKVLRSDSGGEYESYEMKTILKDSGIFHERSAPHTPQQNGVSERMNRTVMEMARSMLSMSRLDKSFWFDAVLAAVHVRNRLPHKANEGKTPIEVFTGVKPDVSYMKVFGCLAYVMIQDGMRTKLDSKVKKCIFIGYGQDEGVKGYRLYDPETNRVIVSRNVSFNESEFMNVDSGESEKIMVPVGEVENASEHGDSETQNGSYEDRDDLEGSFRRSGRQRKPTRQWWTTSTCLSVISSEDPVSVQEAMSRSDAQQWREAMNAEIDSIRKNNVYSVTELQEGRKAIGCKWVFKIKKDGNGNVERYKARLVAKGYSQKAGIDFNETYAPVAKFNSIRLILAIAASKSFVVHQMDVKTAFLNGDLDEDIYMEQPDGMIGEGEEKLVWKLHKSLYGLKQAPRVWYMKLDTFLKNIGFTRCERDYSVYAEKGTGVILAVYVDDLIIVGVERDVIEVKEKLASEFEMSDLGEAHWLLGMKIEIDKSGIWISQGQYIQDVLRKFGMMECKPVGTPMEGKLLKNQVADETKEKLDVPYRQAVGSLMYAMVGTRPDIAVAVSSVSRFLENPEQEHWIAVKRIMRYLRGTLNYGLKYKAGMDIDLVGYCDADWAGDVQTRKSTTGYLFMLSDCCVTWNCRRQPTVALSSTEAEYMATCAAGREVMWLRGLLEEVGFAQKQTTLFADNQSCILLAKNPVHHSRTKHIDVQHHYIRNLVEENIVDLKFVGTNDNVADVLTKPLTAVKHREFSKKMGLCENREN